HARTLGVLRLAPRLAASGALDRFDFAVREQIPNAGLADLRTLLLDKNGELRPGAAKLAHKLDSLASLEEWRGLSMPPKDWVARFRILRNLFRPARPEIDGTASSVLPHERALEWHSQA